MSGSRKYPNETEWRLFPPLETLG